MAKKKNEGSGLQSSAGLMRYFEADDTAIKLNPKMVLGACIGAGVSSNGTEYRLWPLALDGISSPDYFSLHLALLLISFLGGHLIYLFCSFLQQGILISCEN